MMSEKAIVRGRTVWKYRLCKEVSPKRSFNLLWAEINHLDIGVPVHAVTPDATGAMQVVHRFQSEEFPGHFYREKYGVPGRI